MTKLVARTLFIYFISPISWDFMALSFSLALGLLIPWWNILLQYSFGVVGLVVPLFLPLALLIGLAPRNIILRICVILSKCLRAYKPVCVVLGPWH